LFDPKAAATGEPLLVDIALIDEDPSNPRTEFPDAALEELAADIRQRGVLQPIVVHPADPAGRYRIHFGSMRLRAARRCGVAQVPIVVRSAKHDPYAQVAENLKRHGLSPLDLARFIHSRIGAGESNAAVAAHLGMDQTTVAHHLALLELPPELDDALKSGRCTSPRTLYELSKLHEVQPERVKALVSGDSQITRATVATMRAEQAPATTRVRPKRDASSLLAQANGACAQLELALSRIKQVEHELADAELAAVRQRVARLASWSA
jgi:ParB family chromosome partitioning protein